MKIFLILNPYDIKITEFAQWNHRETTKAVVFDENNNIGILYAKEMGRYKLPGGKIEDNENIEQALKRECLEELGVEIEIIDKIGMVTEIRKEKKLCQISYNFVAKTISKKYCPVFSEKEKELGFSIEWVELRNVLSYFTKLNDDLICSLDNQLAEKRDFCILKEGLRLYKKNNSKYSSKNN